MVRHVIPAVPHRLVADDEYMGYHFPAGTLVIGNVWYAYTVLSTINNERWIFRAMFHDERRYPEPDRFDPGRFLNEDGTLNMSAADPAEAAFGFGRRICPGRHLAMASVWITAASILATFNIEKAVDEAGNIIEPGKAYTPGLIRYVHLL